MAWLDEYIKEHIGTFMDSDDCTGMVCSVCRHPVAHYESAYRIATYIVCRHCMARYEADSHRATNIKRLEQDAAIEFHKAIEDFKRRIM